MSEPAEKRGGQSAPESHSPKAKPEILRMAQQAQGNPAPMEEPQAPEAGGGAPPQILRGVPKAHYGAFGGITPFPICLKAVSDYLGQQVDPGDELDYTYAIVACGGAFRFAWDTSEWNPGNVDIMLAYDDAELPFRYGITALGREFKMIWRAENVRCHPGNATKEDYKAFIKEQIDLGRPVISLGPIGPGEAGIITGYRDGGDTLLGWSVFQDWACKTFDDDEGYFITDRWWDEGDFHGVMALGDIHAPRWGVEQILPIAIAALEGRQEGKYAKGIAAYEPWKKAILGADEKDFAMECGGDHLVMMCQGDATDCLMDGRHQAREYFKALAQEHPEEPLYRKIAGQFGIVADTIEKKIYKVLGGYMRGKKQIKALEKPAARRKIGEAIDAMKAADEKALALMKELLAESHSPKAKPAILGMAQALQAGGALPSDTIADPFAGGEPPRASNRITEYHKIQPCENYFLASALCSMGKILGSDIDSLHFYSAITGDMFTYIYSLERKYCDSGITNILFAPQVVKKAYAALGYDCVYLSTGYIKDNFRAVMNAIKASVDKGIPVLSWGMGNVTFLDSGHWGSTMPEGCLIGGYDEGDVLYVNLYCGPERVETDGDGYTAITNGLDTTLGLFFVGEPCAKTPVEEVYREAIASIPALLTLPPADGFIFGQTAFETWADTLLDESNLEGKTDAEIEGLGVIWDIHCAPYCTVCTSDALNFIKTAAKEYKLESAKRLLPLYQEFTKRRQKIWKLQGGFSPPPEKFRQRKFREKIAALLREMGGICGEIVAASTPG